MSSPVGPPGEAPGRSRPVPVRLVHGPVSCAQDLAADDALLAEGRLAVHVAFLSDRAISVGVAVPATAAYLDRARSAGLAVVRRSTGGTGVLHGPGDLAWSLVLPRGHPWVGSDYLRSFGRFGEGVRRWLSELGISSRWVDAPGLSEEYCLLGPRGQVLAGDRGILGGAAQHRTRSALLHHGSITTRLDRTTLRRVFDLGGPGAADRLSSLEEAGLGPRPPEQLSAGLAEALARELERA